ncbi:hypothetical protein GGR57DRAFT_499107 [Xylariaceae sp. FL1272]|nr:hypothetical protein GGR57DRAFT_499107 [Xylariaceae sp. FL1272]
MSSASRNSVSLSSDEQDFFLPYEKSRVKGKKRLTKNEVRSVVLQHAYALTYFVHIVFVLINVTWFTANVQYKRATCTGGGGTTYEPAGAPYTEEFTVYQLPIGQKSKYTTLDRKVADEAWMDITMRDSLGWLKIPQEKVDVMNQSSVEFRDGSGYFFGMDVFHQLHCLNYLRKKTVLYNHLYPSEGEGEDQQIPPEFHIHSIRLSLQCHADTTLVPQRWAGGWLEPWAVWTNKHICRNFDAIRDWARKNTPHLAGQLSHPELGTVVSGRLNLSALPIWQEEYDKDIVLGQLPFDQDRYKRNQDTINWGYANIMAYQFLIVRESNDSL